MKNQKPFIFRDFSRGAVRTVQNSICPVNSFKLALNLDSEKEIGSLVSRDGTSIVGAQAVASATCLGLHYHRDSVASNHILFGVFSDGTNNDIYDMSDGTKSLADDTKALKTRFCTYLNSTVRVNGTDAAKSYNGSAWVTTGGAFDEDNMPLGNVVIEWKDRVYTAGVAASPSILYYSGVADPSARTVSWTTGNGQIEIEQEDGGGAITALEKVPGYLLVFKERTMKRWDGSSTYPEDLISVGAPTQEAVCRGRGLVFFANQEGVWATNGSYPQRISKPIQDLWDAIPAANISSIATFCDDNYVYVYAGDITLTNSFTNILFRYSIDSQIWDVWSYANEFTGFTWYIVSSQKVIVGGDKDGQALRLNSGNTDYNGTPITYSLETQDIDLGMRGKVKEIDTVNFFSQNIRTGQFMYRSNSDQDKDWKSVRSITSDVEEINEFKARGNWFNFKITGVTSTGNVKIQGFEIPENAINITQNVV
jgi:hypothetical protein